MAMAATGTDDLENELVRSYLTLEDIDTNIFRASPVNLWRPLAGRFVYGGQVIGQALIAACRTVKEEQHIHSLHCYFLRGGNAKKHILYHVDRTRDGSTYSSRAIKATQDSVPIFTMQASFKMEESDPLKHQYVMPVVPGPEELVESYDFLQSQLENEETTEESRDFIKRILERKMHIERRPVDPHLYHGLTQGEPRRYIWVKASGHIGPDRKLQQCIAGFMCDMLLLGAALQPAVPGTKVGFMASLDHSMWFHNPFRADEWMLYEIECPQCGAGKALCTGRMWRQDGVLAVSMAQEGVVRSAL